MIQGRCPICSKRFAIAALDDLPSFPFCCERCRLIDLGRWIEGEYVIPGPPALNDPQADIDGGAGPAVSNGHESVD
jgi:endogenous inhibitor of DNA gyrase (YacG/DUF329 family)